STSPLSPPAASSTSAGPHEHLHLWKEILSIEKRCAHRKKQAHHRPPTTTPPSPAFSPGLCMPRRGRLAPDPQLHASRQWLKNPHASAKSPGFPRLSAMKSVAAYMTARPPRRSFLG